LQIPADLSEAASKGWARTSARQFAERAAAVLAEREIEAAVAEYQERLGRALADPAEVLVWYPGKDLLAALTGWLAAKGVPNAGEFRARMRDWIRANPDATVAALIEWRRLRDTLNR